MPNPNPNLKLTSLARFPTLKWWWQGVKRTAGNGRVAMERAQSDVDGLPTRVPTSTTAQYQFPTHRRTHTQRVGRR